MAEGVAHPSSQANGRRAEGLAELLGWKIQAGAEKVTDVGTTPVSIILLLWSLCCILLASSLGLDVDTSSIIRGC